MRILSVLFLPLIFINIAFAEDRLQFRQVFTEIPSTSILTLKRSFSKESLPYWGAIIGSTALLYHYDEEIYADLQKRGRNWRIGNDDNTKPLVTFNGQEIIRLPSDTGSALYFLGDGWLHVGIGGAFLGTGKFTDNTRAYNTGVMLWHGILVSTIFNQTLKRSFGRESPEVSTEKRGRWKPFPGFNEYNTKTASYDAMPSGHVMTATLTFTIISEQYPEYNHIVYPLAGVWVSALMFEMVNNGVHWASDYPLGIAMGYVVGKAATRMGKKETDPQKPDTTWHLVPTFQGLLAYREF